MKKNIILSFAFLLIANSCLFAQEQPKKMKKIRIHDISLLGGAFGEYKQNGLFPDFFQLVPQSALLNGNLAGFTEFVGVSYRTNPMFSGSLGIQFRNKKKKTYNDNPVLRVGLMYFSGSVMQANLSRDTRKPFDTLTSSQTGLVVYIDSVNSDYLNLSYSCSQVRLDVSVIYRLNPGDILSIYTGFGINAGASFKASTNISYYTSRNTVVRYPNGDSSSTGYSVSSDDILSEHFKNKNNFGLSVYIPIGIDLQLARKQWFWKRMHLYYEIKPCINITMIPELSSRTNLGIQHGVGLRYVLK